MDLVVSALERLSPGLHDVEIVERKGLGHPDTICDGIAEHVCVRLCRYYLERFGRVLHHNVDKVLLCGGSARPAFGGGEVLEPIEVYLAGRATSDAGGVRIPIHEIAIEACRDWLRDHVRGLDVDRHVKIVSRLRPGSSALSSLFRKDESVRANDTSCGSGFSPLTDLENVVLEVERALRSAGTSSAHPAFGEDIKVMGVRRGSHIDLTIGCALIDRFIRDLDAYARTREDARRAALDAARRVTPLEVSAIVNAADDLERGEVFLTVTGTSAEAGDDGEVGRGNRASGLITPYRRMTLEAAAGKNPVTHVGKLYSLVGSRAAAAVVAAIPGVTDADCTLSSQIGRFVSDPHIVDVRLGSGERLEASGTVKEAVAEIVRNELRRLTELRSDLLDERVRVY